MIPQKFWNVIEGIAEAKVPGNWFFTGSIGMALEGMPHKFKPKDIDIAVDKKTLQRFRKTFGQQGKQTADSVRFKIDQTTIELCLKSDNYKFFKRVKKQNGINTLSLQDQTKRYEQAGNQQKADKIKKLLKKQP